MPSKPRVQRKTSNAAQRTQAITAIKEEQDAAAMPPPANPPPMPLILEKDVDAMSQALKNAIVKTGQIYQFFNDSRRLGVRRHAASPPLSLTASLGREIEKYDQLCDSIESHLLRAISALKRDVQLEEEKIKETEMAAIATRTRSKSKSLSPKSARLSLPTISGALGQEITLDSVVDPATLQALNRTQNLLLSSSVPLSRRTSAISLSSLHRPPFPHKLDLSSASLRITPEEASIFSSGLASPVTLAPKSARPSANSEYPPDFMTAFTGADATSQSVDINLAIPALTTSNGSGLDSSVNQMGITVDTSIGDSADKPIELDMDMDLAMSNVTALFGDSAESGTNGTNTDKQDHTLQMDMLEAFSGGANDLFASFGAASPSNAQSIRHDASAQLLSASSLPITGVSFPGPEAGPSPGSLLANFSAVESDETSIAPDPLPPLPGADAQFDLSSLDFLQLDSGFFGSAPDNDSHMAEMEAILDMSRDQQLPVSDGPN